MLAEKRTYVYYEKAATHIMFDQRWVNISIIATDIKPIVELEKRELALELSDMSVESHIFFFFFLTLFSRSKDIVDVFSPKISVKKKKIKQLNIINIGWFSPNRYGYHHRAEYVVLYRRHVPVHVTHGL